MKQRPRIYYSEMDKALMWDRWQKGETLNSIARLFDRHHSSIQRVLAETGGIRPQPRRRSRPALTLDRLRLRGMTGASDEFLIAATAQNLRRLALWLSTGPPESRVNASVA